MNLKELYQEFDRLTEIIDKNIDSELIESKVKVITNLAKREVIVCKIERLREHNKSTDNAPAPAPAESKN